MTSTHTDRTAAARVCRPTPVDLQSADPATGSGSGRQRPSWPWWLRHRAKPGSRIAMGDAPSHLRLVRHHSGGIMVKMRRLLPSGSQQPGRRLPLCGWSQDGVAAVLILLSTAVIISVRESSPMGPNYKPSDNATLHRSICHDNQCLVPVTFWQPVKNRFRLTGGRSCYLPWKWKTI